ncbi:MAG TPA: HNH endonuclease, partial [Candidatus Krumholzibacteria bacterium]|nr:HNH endonuclease [Candidatus Krumholzibacteria bacterium]
VRRIQSARCIARFPEVYGLLESNEVNLSTISQVSRVLKRDNKDEILARIRGRSYREVKAIVSGYQPGAMPADEVRPIAVLVQAPVATGTSASAPLVGVTAPPVACENGDCIRHGCATDMPAIPTPMSGGMGGAVTIQSRRLFKFTATEDFEKKFKKIRSLASHRLSPSPSFEQVFELAMDCFLERHDPSARSERREQQKQKATAQSPVADAGPREQRPHKDSSSHTRYVPARVRDQMFLRDRGQCAYVGPSGRRCGSSFVLQIDHIQPVARGGASTPGNLRLLCAYHNRLEAERLMGASAAGRRRDTVTGAPRLRQ